MPGWAQGRGFDRLHDRCSPSRCPSPVPVPGALGPRTAVPEQGDRGLVPPPRLALLQQHPLHDLLLVGQPVHGEHVEPADHEDAQGAGAHGQAGARPLPRQPRHPPPAPAAPPRHRAALRHQARAMRAGGPARLSSAQPRRRPPPSPPGGAGPLLPLRRGSLLSGQRRRLPPLLTVIWSLAFPAR